MFSFARCDQKCFENKKAYLKERVRVMGVRERQQEHARDSKIESWKEREVEGGRGGRREMWKEREVEKERERG